MILTVCSPILRAPDASAVVACRLVEEDIPVEEYIPAEEGVSLEEVSVGAGRLAEALILLEVACGRGDDLCMLHRTLQLQFGDVE